jgi:restriction system protein
MSERPASDEPSSPAATHERDGDVRVGVYWGGKLDQWLAEIAALDPDGKAGSDFQDWSFPTDALLRQYVAGIAERSEAEFRHLLRCLLFPDSTFGGDEWALDAMLRDRETFDRLSATEYGARLLRWVGGQGAAHPSIRWILGLLPERPRDALAVIDAYTYASGQLLPEGRYEGLRDVATLIRARYESRSGHDARQVLQGISPRELEILVAHVYSSLGYRCTLTPARADGGRDIIAKRSRPGRSERRLIECKHYSGAVPVAVSRALIGVVSTEHATSGDLVTTGRITRGARELARSDSRLGLVDGDDLMRLLGECFGSGWPENMDFLLRWSERDSARSLGGDAG